MRATAECYQWIIIQVLTTSTEMYDDSTATKQPAVLLYNFSMLLAITLKSIYISFLTYMIMCTCNCSFIIFFVKQRKELHIK